MRHAPILVELQELGEFSWREDPELGKPRLPVGHAVWEEQIRCGVRHGYLLGSYRGASAVRRLIIIRR